MPESSPPPPTLFPLVSRAGVRRDGTMFDGGSYYIEAEWCRFQRNQPRKIGGFREITSDLSGPVSEIFVSTRNGLATMHSGSPDQLERIVIDQFGTATGVTVRTPTSGFVADPNNLWQMDALYDAGGIGAALIAHAAPNSLAIDQETQTNVFMGDLNGTGALVQITGTDDVPAISGGCVAAYPYMFYYGDNGFVTWSGPNLPADCRTASGGGGVNGQRVAASKIVRGLVNRGGPGNAPSALFWSLDSLVRASFVGGAPVFRFDTVSDQASILSSNAPIEYDGLYYWAGVDRFLFYNGVVQELPNQMNINFFFDNLNFAQRQAVFVHKVPRFGEIWWCFPYGASLVPNWAVVYNVREQTWYDTPLPDGGRSAAHFAQTFRYPVMAGTVADAAGKYSLWQHEFGVDRVTLAGTTRTTAIRSFFETGMIAMPAEGWLQNGWAGTDKWTDAQRIEPDFLVQGGLTLTVRGRKYAMAPDEDIDYVLWPLADANGATTYKQDLRTQRRIIRFRVSSNEVGGDYQSGKSLLNFLLGDARQ